jgi:Cu2+-exporting ATPase
MARDLAPSLKGRSGSALSWQARQTDLGGIRANSSLGTVFIGSRRFMRSADVRGLEQFARPVEALVAQGVTPVYVSLDGDLVAVAGVGDALRDDVEWSLREIQRMGWKVGILSGDHSEIVQAVAARLGIAAELARGELLPENKVQVVQGHADAEPVVMIGDGVNDSAALAAASVGIAVRGGAEASLSAASVYLAREGLSDFIALVRLARTTMNTIRWNFAASLGYNALAVGLAATGLIHPLLAAILMPVSSLTVVSISLMLPRDWSRERGISR